MAQFRITTDEDIYSPSLKVNYEILTDIILDYVAPHGIKFYKYNDHLKSELLKILSLPCTTNYLYNSKCMDFDINIKFTEWRKSENIGDPIYTISKLIRRKKSKEVTLSIYDSWFNYNDIDYHFNLNIFISVD